MSAWIPLLGIVATLVTLAVAGLRLGGPARILVLFQVVYWSISYLARPLVLMVVRPSPSFADSIADPRLAWDDYSQSMSDVLSIIFIGLCAYTACVWFIGPLWFPKGRVIMPDVGRAFTPTLAAMFVLGLGIRALLSIGIANSLVGTLSFLATAGAVGLVVYYRSTRRRVVFVVLTILLSELIWSIQTASKTPVLAVILALVLRLASHERLRKRTIAAFMIMGLVVVSFFPLLQSFKTSDSVARDLTTANQSYPAYVAPFLDIIRRFDQFSAVTDSYSIEPGAWVDLPEYVGRAFSSAIPAFAQSSEKGTAGRNWAAEVRALSRPGANTEVSLAEGFIAEGNALSGLSGVVAAAGMLFLLTAFTSRLLSSRKLPFATWGLLLVAYPVLFERGLLGGIEVASKSFQIILVVWLLHLAISRSNSATPAPLSSLSHQPNSLRRVVS